MSDDFKRDPFAEALRASLRAHAEEAPRGDLLAERIVTAAERVDVGGAPRRGWRTWSLPLVAAVAVAGVVVAVIGIENYRPGSSSPPAASRNQSAGPSILNTSAPAQTESSVPSTATVHRAAELTGVNVLDLTFVSENEGWALGSANCFHGPGKCVVLLHTLDGRTWKTMTTTPFNVPGVAAGCKTRCVQNVRFANPDVGYVFGPDALLMTTDAGKSWQLQDGGAIALETLDNNVIRVTSSHFGCPGPCDVRVETAAIGSDSWTPSDLSTELAGTGGALLSRGGHDAYLLMTRNPAGGASDETSTLYRSTDDGRTWIKSGEPCPQTGHEVDSTAIAGGGDDRVSALCMNRLAPQRPQVVVSEDAGAHFSLAQGKAPLEAANLLAGDPNTVLVAAGVGMARSVDGGRIWHIVRDVKGNVTFVGFESETVGRAVTDGNTIWTTQDGGKSWSRVAFG
jgi:photosystem II stability/assembly factor-like uncharacterized protein